MDSGELVIEAAPFGAFVPFDPVTRVAVGMIDPGEKRSVTVRIKRDRLPATANPLGGWFKNFGGLGSGFTVEILDLMAHSEWIGNINIYLDRDPKRAVEVHRAQGLRVRPGVPVSAFFVLPPTAGGYRTSAESSDLDWRAQVVRIQEGLEFLLVVPPSESGRSARVTVEVTRLRDRRMIPVEFSFETTKGGAADHLGCIAI